MLETECSGLKCITFWFHWCKYVMVPGFLYYSRILLETNKGTLRNTQWRVRNKMMPHHLMEIKMITRQRAELKNTPKIKVKNTVGCDFYPSQQFQKTWPLSLTLRWRSLRPKQLQYSFQTATSLHSWILAFTSLHVCTASQGDDNIPSAFYEAIPNVTQ